MALAKPMIVKETEQELKQLMRKQPVHLKNRVQMLLVVKSSKVSLSKESLAKILKINHNTAQQWRTKYSEGGIDRLLADGRIGFKPSIISKDLHQEIEKKLRSPKEAFTSYVDLVHWITKHYLPNGVSYQTINSYVKRKFGAKIKVARKSHAKKDDKAVDRFKKTSS